jgi:sugar lactone lactonase YvrE
LDKSGNLYLADGANNRVRKIVLVTGIITTVAGTGTFGYNGDNIPATNAELYIPDAVYTDTTGNIYIGDALNHRVRKVTVATGIISTIAGNGIAGNTGDGGQATNATIYDPDGLYVDSSGNLYIADLLNYNIRKVAINGSITTIAGNGSMGYSGDGGLATNATFFGITKSIVDNYGNIIIADADNNVLRKVDVTTGIITTICGDGTAGYSGDGGPAINAKLSGPYGMYIDKQNDIYFAEYGNGTIRRIDGTTGIITTVAGGTFGYGGDGGPATDAKLIPEDLTFDQYGTMYIADYENNRIRMVYNPKLASPQPSPQVERGLYPNPARDAVTVEGAEGDEVVIYDMVGRQFDKLTMTGHKETVNISGLQPGVYVVQVINEDGEKKIFKVVKE